MFGNGSELPGHIGQKLTDKERTDLHKIVPTAVSGVHLPETPGFVQPERPAQPRFLSDVQPTVQSLVGPDVELPKGLAGASSRAPGHIGSANVLRERSPQLSAINDGGWEQITLIVDSGASDTVIPPKVCRAEEFRHSSKVGTEYEVADGGVAKNMGEKLCEMNIN